MGFGLQDFFRMPKFFAAAPAATHITSKNTVAYAVTAASKPGEGPRMTTDSSIHTFFFFFGKFASLAGFKKILQPLFELQRTKEERKNWSFHEKLTLIGAKNDFDLLCFGARVAHGGRE